MAHIVFVNRFYWPDEPATAQLLTDLAEGLAGAGHDVTVITSRPAFVPLPAREIRRGVTIRRVARMRSRRRTVIGQALDFAAFHARALYQLFSDTRRGRIIVALTDPPLLGVGVALVARLRGARVVHWVQDIYPEVAIQVTQQAWLGALRPTRSRAWRRADACVTVGADMAGVVQSAGIADERLHVIPNWAPAGLASRAPSDTGLRAAWGLTGKFVVAYAGNLGRVHDLDPVLDLAEALRGEPRVAFVFIGAGARRNATEARARERGLDNVQFRSPQPRGRLTETLAVGDVHVITLRAGCERFVFPSKLYGIAAAGRPVLFIGPADCEVARIVRAEGLGLAADRGDLAVMKTWILESCRDPVVNERRSQAGPGFAARHSATIGVERWRAVLDEVQVNP